MDSLVSIVVPVYNVEDYLERCIESITNQTYVKLEIVLVDDGATDSSGAICDKYAKADDRIKVIHKENGGLSDARNVGLLNTTGKYIVFTDSDDHIGETLVYDCMIRMEEDESDILIFDFIRVEDENEELCTLEGVEEGTYTLQSKPVLIFGSPSACNKMFRREFLIKSGITFPVGKFYEDLGTTPKLLAIAKSISYIKKAYYYYMIRGGSIMTAQKFERNYIDRTQMLDGIIDYYKEKDLFDSYRNELEFLSVMNGYFLPSREIILADHKSPVIRKFKEYIYKRFPNFKENPYLDTLTRKDKMHLRTIEKGNYGFMVMLSKARRLKEKWTKS
ncbi:MAG: glycosyltransferase [Suipraeoptans sp.]